MLKHVKWVNTSLKWKRELKITIIGVIMFPAMLDLDKLVIDIIVARSTYWARKDNVPN